MDIQLLFPTRNISLDLGESIGFDRVLGELPVNRLEDIDGVMSEQDAHDIWTNT